MVARQGFLPVRELCRQLRVSEATARRDLSALENEKKIKRTFGGALSEFENRFPSFTERCGLLRRAKAKIAASALSYLAPDITCYLDAGTTMFTIAEEFRARPVTPLKIVTCNIPLGELLAGIDGVRVFFLAGELLKRQSVLLGDEACRSLEFWRFDVAFLSAEAMDSAGIWNSQAAVVKLQKAVLRRSACSIFCLDTGKLDAKAPHFLLPWNKVDVLLSDASRTRLQQAGIRLRVDQYRPADRKASRVEC